MRSITITSGLESPVHPGNQHQIKPGHVAAQLRGTCGLAYQVELVVQVFVEFGSTTSRGSQAAPSLDSPPTQEAIVRIQTKVLLDRRQHAGGPAP